MGLVNWLIKRRANSLLKAVPENKINDYVTEYLKRTQKEHADALKTAQTLNKASLMDLQTKKLKQEMKTLLDDDEDEEEEYEEESEDDEDDNLIEGVVKNLLNNAVKNPAQPSPAKDYSKLLETLTPEQKRMASDYFGVKL